ncbi:unnamed protein product [Symbiodinium natans]|uniref:Right handed beta helix domain-containing protein n=1 Tax=Symbiodinium natans TaxID=878477 RepID=A0A812PKT1_9DINO|nr:unnamed protein product [Symbiodinium natans]
MSRFCRLGLVCALVCHWRPLCGERVSDRLLLDTADSFLLRDLRGQRRAEDARIQGALAKVPPPPAAGPQSAIKVGLPSCAGGVLELAGSYEVVEAVTIEGPCQVMGSAELNLLAPVRFRGNASFFGRLTVKAIKAVWDEYDATLDSPCIFINGSLRLHPAAKLRFEDCRNGQKQEENARGGGLSIEGDAELLGGSLHFSRCQARGDGRQTGKGGALYVGGAFRNWDATIEATGCSATFGGTIYVKEPMAVLGGKLAFSGSTSQKDGGAVYVNAPMKVSGGNLTILESKAEGGGGAIRAQQVDVSGGSLTTQETNAEKRGGAIGATHINVFGGSMTIHQTRSKGEGGAMTAFTFNMTGGRVAVNDSRAGSEGGAVYSVDLDISGGNLTINGAYAWKSGGAIWGDRMNVSGGSLAIVGSRTHLNGGAIHTEKLMAVSGGHLVARRSNAGLNGGCIRTDRFEQPGGVIDLEGCHAGQRRAGQGGAIKTYTFRKAAAAWLAMAGGDAEHGGGIYVSDRADVQAENLQISNCRASTYGGCLFLEKPAQFHGPLQLQNCSAKGGGGGIFAAQGLRAERVLCVGCVAPVAALLHVEDGNGSFGTIRALSRTRRASPSIVAGGPSSRLQIATVDCLEAPGCGVAAENAEVAQLLCQRGEGRQGLANGDGHQCQTCPEDHIRLVMDEAHCTPCPDMGNLSIWCSATELELPVGYMVDYNRSDPGSVSKWYRCPSDQACPGGYLNASSVAGEPAQELVPMCEEGYGGVGCTNCTMGYGRGDSNILQCVHCSSSPRQATWYAGFFLAKNLALFTSAVVSASKGHRAASSTLLNQLMSFSAVAGITMSGAMQTNTFKIEIGITAKDVFRVLMLPVSVAQGQTNAGGGMSGECLLELFNVEKSLHHTHVLMSLWPALLIACLAIAKGGWLAVVVGVNVFLPAFLAGFGKYLVAFRLRPESDPIAGGLRWDFLPPGPHMTSHVSLRIALVVLSIVALLAMSVGSWIFAVWFRTQPPPAHVAYLVQAYRPGCEAWEVERLVRKVVLALITATLPVTLSPALQMEAVTLVLIASLVAHLCYWPYKDDSWNRVEIGLLFVGLTITGLTTCLIANEHHWAKSSVTQRALVFLICSVAGGICVVMMASFLVAYIAERRKRV